MGRRRKTARSRWARDVGTGNGGQVEFLQPPPRRLPMNQPLKRLLAGVATLRPDDPGLRAGLSVSARTGAELHLLHVETSASSPGAPVTLSRGGALRGVVENVAPGVTRTGRVLCRALTGDPERVL